MSVVEGSVRLRLGDGSIVTYDCNDIYLGDPERRLKELTDQVIDMAYRPREEREENMKYKLERKQKEKEERARLLAMKDLEAENSNSEDEADMDAESEEEMNQE